MIYIDKTEKAIRAFLKHFHYTPNYPKDVKKDESDEYNETLYKSIDDDFDYTIEKYGTRVVDESLPEPTIIWD